MQSAGRGPTGALEVAHARLLRDPSFQLAFLAPPPQPHPTPSWLVALAHALGQLFPWLFWGLVVVGAGTALMTTARALLRSGVATSRPTMLADHEPSAAHAVGPRLADADHLARAGCYGDAVHVLLRCALQHLSQTVPDLRDPSLTAREAAEAVSSPPERREALGGLVWLVERYLFAGEALDAEEYAVCRSHCEQLTAATP